MMATKTGKTALRLSSMTGFARGTGRDERYEWVWELKCVNGRGLDIRCRTPNGLDMLEATARTAASERFTRGNLTMTLQLNPVATTPSVTVNRQLLEQLLEVSREYKDAPGVLPPRLDGLLAVRGVIEAADTAENGEELQTRIQGVLKTLETTLDELYVTRSDEGRRLEEVLREHISEVETLSALAKACVAAQPQAVSERLNEQLNELLDDRPGVSEERLAQELAALLVKSDVREEVDRLAAHVEAINELLDGGGAVGRRLDFLAQELNREANTICAKAPDVELSRVGLELKAVIDRFREQVQNIE
tara:strand:+ start:516 stop:1433 length:918 start_codon:yes stop_codon:yes gene_type:complete